MFVILSPQGNNNTGLSLFVNLPGDLIEVFFVDHNLELCWRLINPGLFFLGDEYYLGKVFNGIGNDIVDELIVYP